MPVLSRACDLVTSSISRGPDRMSALTHLVIPRSEATRDLLAGARRSLSGVARVGRALLFLVANESSCFCGERSRSARTARATPNRRAGEARGAGARAPRARHPNRRSAASASEQQIPRFARDDGLGPITDPERTLRSRFRHQRCWSRAPIHRVPRPGA